MTNAYGWTNTYATVDEFGNMVARFNHDAGGTRINNPLLGYSGYVMDFSVQKINNLQRPKTTQNPIIYSRPRINPHADSPHPKVDSPPS
jgi:hypothetical protein